MQRNVCCIFFLFLNRREFPALIECGTVGVSAECELKIAKRAKKKTDLFNSASKDTNINYRGICPRLTATTTIPNEHATLWKYSSFQPIQQAPSSLHLSFRLMVKTLPKLLLHVSHGSINFRHRSFVACHSKGNQVPLLDKRKLQRGRASRIICLMWMFHYSLRINHILLSSAKRQAAKSFTCRLVTHGNLSFLSCDPDGIFFRAKIFW